MAKSTKNLTEWTVEDFNNYFSKGPSMFNGDTFQEIANLAKELKEIEREPVSYDMANERLQILDGLLQTTFQYSNTHLNPRTSGGKERREVIDAFMKLCNKERQMMGLSSNVKYFDGQTLDKMREGISYSEVSNLKAQCEEIKKDPMTVENVIKYTNALSKYTQAIEVYRQNTPDDPSLASGLERDNIDSRLKIDLHIYQPCLDSMRDLRTIRGMIKEGKSWDDLLTLREATIELTGTEEKKGANVSQRIQTVHNGKKGFFTESVVARQDKEFWMALTDYIDTHQTTEKDILIARAKNVITRRLGKSVSNLDKEIQNQMNELDRDDVIQDEQYKFYETLLKNDSVKQKIVEIADAVDKASKSFQTGQFDKRDRIEMDKRNVATSRMAELLGVGNLIAHSEKMSVIVDGTKVSGCFMEFAEGIDPKTDNKEERKILSKTSYEIGGEFSKECSSLAILDVICAQTDRHNGNLFIKVGEPDANGQRKVVGIQGIDNDMAFSRRAYDSEMVKNSQSVHLENILFVDAALANRVKNLSEEDIKYAVGDLLNKNEIDGIMERLEQVKTHIKENTLQLTEKEWNFEEYTLDMVKSKLGKNREAGAQKYIDKLNEIKDVQNNAKGPWDSEKYIESKVSWHIRREAKNLKQAERAEAFDKIVAGKEAAGKTQPTQEVKKETSAAVRRQSTSYQKLSAEDKTNHKSSFVKPKEKAAELDLGFEEITHEDIKAAREKFGNKKPVIGAHRAGKR